MSDILITMDEYDDALERLRTRLHTIGSLADPEGTRARITELDGEMESPGFWDDQARAPKLSAERTRLARKLERYERLVADVDGIEETIELARMSEGQDKVEAAQMLDEALPPLEDELEALQEESLFTGEYDAGDAIVSIQAGEGGVDAQDWAEMLVGMYLKFASRRGFKVEFNQESKGEEAGIRSAAFTVHGDYAYGVFNAESGVHRLVRLSPFDKDNRRQTSFAQVEVVPVLDDEVEIDIDPADLRVDTYRASGAGGQHINKTDSAIRITHEPTGVVVQCQNERSQHQNRDTAMKMLKGKLFELERQKREAQIDAEKGEAQNIGFGSQIRSYVLQPYQMVKDLRTRHESGNVDKVLDGELDEFVRTFLLHKAHGGSNARTENADLEE